MKLIMPTAIAVKRLPLGWVFSTSKFLCVFLCATLGHSVSHAQSSRVALLVGVGQYRWLPPEANLQGPANDVAALKEVLVRKWGFAASDVRVLVDAQATRAAILSELVELKKRSRAGSEVLIYLSGHGTSALNSGNQLPLPYGTGAFVPHDARPDAAAPLKTLIVGRTDLRPLILDLEQAQRRLWVISDSCYAGQQVRSVQAALVPELPSRMIPLVLNRDDAADQRADLALAAQSTAAQPYPYQATAYVSASAEGERARDIPASMVKSFPTVDGKPHGAFTDALLRVLDGQWPGDLDGDGYLSLTEVHRSVSDFMASRAYGHTPQRLPAVLEDVNALGQRPVLSMANVASKPSRDAQRPLKVFTSPQAPVPESLKALPDVVFTKTPEGADLTLSQKSTQWILLSAGGDTLTQVPLAEAARLTSQIRQLAWANRVRQLGDAHRRSALPMEIDPAAVGGNFKLGETLTFVIKPDKPATVLLINVASDGKVSVLYPARRNELQPLPGQKAQVIPGAGPSQRILVQEPLGMDIQMAFAFDQTPPQFDRLLNVTDADPADPRLSALESWLVTQSGGFSFASTSLRVSRP
jgi:uncharacterized caspase-like protein